MQTLNKLLDTARKTCDRDSDRALAQALKVTGQTVMQWRKGVNRITDEHLIKVIDMAQADPALIVLVRQEGAEAKAERKAWGALWDRLSPVTTVIGVCCLAVGLSARASEAKPLEIQQFAGAESGRMYIM
ncbi:MULTISPECIES: DUF3693 domain-containing protein [Luteimonas]|uniref:DUF3693 domain-containing protein n=1 Tax=Luteimonas TaxID=83614 RepID=UPI000C7B52E3|nr:MULTISPECIES: DUF3693 domain-containing protein [Luteimonas]